MSPNTSDLGDLSDVTWWRAPVTPPSVEMEIPNGNLVPLPEMVVRTVEVPEVPDDDYHKEFRDSVATLNFNETPSADHERAELELRDSTYDDTDVSITEQSSDDAMTSAAFDLPDVVTVVSPDMMFTNPVFDMVTLPDPAVASSGQPSVDNPVAATQSDLPVQTKNAFLTLNTATMATGSGSTESALSPPMSEYTKVGKQNSSGSDTVCTSLTSQDSTETNGSSDIDPYVQTPRAFHDSVDEPGSPISIHGDVMSPLINVHQTEIINFPEAIELKAIADHENI